MSRKIIVMLCENFKNELEVVKSNNEFENTIFLTYPPNCGTPPIKKEFVENKIKELNLNNKSKIILVGGPCVSPLFDIYKNDNKVNVKILNQCLSLAINETMINDLISRKAYLLTPGWLLNWENNIKKLGFKKKAAQDFFKQNTDRLILLNTLTKRDDLKDELDKLSSFLNIESEIINIGTEHFELIIKEVYNNARLSIQISKKNIEIQNARSLASEFALAFDLISNLNKTFSENDAIINIIKILEILFAAKKIHFLAYNKNNQPENKIVTNKTVINDDEIINKLTAKKDNFGINTGENGFFIKIKRKGKIYGIIEILNVEFPKYLNRYLNLSLSLVPIFSIVIENTRTYQKIKNKELENVNLISELKKSNEQLENTLSEINILNKKLIATQHALEEALVKAEDASKIKTEFLAMMSHELRTPLAGMMGFSHLLSDDETLNKDQKECANYIYISGNKLMNLLNDILEISVIEAGRIKLNYAKVDIEEILKDIRILLEEKFNSKNIFFNYEVSAVRNLISDAARIRQIFFNLIGNALKFTHEGSIKVKAEKKNNKYIFSVSDTGKGISKENVEKIFETFNRGDLKVATREYEGTGLGLSITKKLVEVLGGSIWLESELNKGSTFYFSLPVKPKKIVLEKNKKENKHHDHKIHILFYDDEDFNFFFLSKILELQKKYISKGTKNIENLIKELIDNPEQDLIIIGLEDNCKEPEKILYKIKTVKDDIPVIAVISNIFCKSKLHLLDKGFSEVIYKPISTKKLLEAIQKHIK